MKPMNSISRHTRMALLAAGLTLMVSVPASASQEVSALNQEHWGEWRASSGGFVGRRREPPGMQLAVEERRLPEVQVQQRLLERPGAKGRERAAQASGRAGSSQSVSDLDAYGSLQVQVLNDATSAWLKTAEPGLYSVSLDEIAQWAGMDGTALRARAQDGRLNLLNEGQPVSWHYDADTDSLQFAAEAYETFYAEGNAYELVFGDTLDSQRMSETRPLPPGQQRRVQREAQPAPFLDTVRFEEDADMLFNVTAGASEPDADFWFWDYLWGGFRDEIVLDLDLPDPAPAGTGELRVELRGWTELNPGNEHQVYAELNGQRVGSVTWDGFDAATLVAQFDQGLLKAEGANVLRLGNVYAAGTNPGQYLNAVEFDYQRMPVARDGELWLRGAAGGAQTVTGFAMSDVMVIESPVRDAILRRDVRVYAHGSGWAVDFFSTSGADYLIIESPALRFAEIDGPATANLRDQGNVADYLIIAPREFAGTAEALAAHRSASFGAAKIAWLDDVYKAFGAGRVDPFAIGRFMQTAMNDWSQPPSMVVLVGKGSLDHKDRLGIGDSFVPVVMTSNPWSLAPSDSRLLGFDDGITPFAYGRLAITNDAEGIAYVAKLTRHESSMRDMDRMATVTADNPDQGGEFHAYAGATAARLEAFGLDVVWESLHPANAVRATLGSSDTWNDNIYVTYDGHGSITRLGDRREAFLTAAVASGLVNTNLSVFSALTCASGDDSRPGTRSLASALVLNPDGGAIASLAPTGLSNAPGANTLGLAFVDSLFRSNEPVGAAVASAKRSVDGRISSFMSPMYTVLGDPAARAQ